MTTRAECIAKAAEEMKMEPFKGPFSAEPYDSARWFVADGLRRAVSPLISEEAAQWLCDRLNAAARDAAPIAGERTGFTANPGEPVPCVICTKIIAVHENDWCDPPEYVLMCMHGPGPTISVSGADKAAVIAEWNKFHDGIRGLAADAQAALPSGGGAREAATEIIAYVRREAIGTNSQQVLDGITAIITKHIPSAPAGLTGALEAAQAVEEK